MTIDIITFTALILLILGFFAYMAIENGDRK